jgi:hypothetical protein
MKISSTTHRIAAVLAGIAVLAALSGVAQGATSTSKPAGMTKAEYRALMLRSEALNQKYRLGAWKGVPAGMTAPQYRALKIRSEALNKMYGLGRWSAPAAATTPTGSSHGFAWGAFGIGAVAMLGLALLVAGAIAGRRYTRGAPRVRTS